MTDYLINFINNLDPNGQDLLHWPNYNSSVPELLTFLDGPALSLSEDTFRQDGTEFLTQLYLANPV